MNKAKVLIAEDEKPLQNAMKLKLEKAGYAVATALDGAEAKKLLAQDKYDILLLDLIMPVEDGFSVLEYVDEKDIKTPIVVMSNLSQASDQDMARNLGAWGVFTKADTSLEQLVAIVADIVEKK